MGPLLVSTRGLGDFHGHNNLPFVMASDAVGSERISRIVGYLLKKGNFNTVSPNLPQRIAIFGEANHANQSSLDLTPKEITSAKQAGELYGYGSPIHMAMRILRPLSGDGVGGVPTVAYPQAAAGGAAAKIYSITPSGVATKNGTHYVKVAGRNTIDGAVYAINVEDGDTAADITAKIEDAVNGVLSSPFSATSDQYETTLTSKWRGLTANSLQVEIDTGNDELGLEYVVASEQAGSATPSIAAALALIGNVWNTMIINCYGTVTTTMDAFEAFNGIADPESPTGRYSPTTWKPCIVLTGSVADDPTAITDSRKAEMTIAICPAPGSKGHPLEAAANMATLAGPQFQDEPHLDVAGRYYPDMPTPTDPSDVGSMTDYNNRDLFVKKGCSTVDLVNGKYQVQDFVTTYHPDGEPIAHFRFCSNLNIDWNVRYGVLLLEDIHERDHAIAADQDVVSVDDVIKPKQVIQILNTYADDLTQRALTVDAAFMKDSIKVNIGTGNPDRLEKFFRYKRRGFARIISTTAEAGFNFGTLN